MREFFENLKQIRISKGISLEEISKISHLSLKYLNYIEDGQLDKLPRGYDRIFFKRYLNEIGENKEEVWRDFNLFFGAGPFKENLPYSSDIPHEEKSELILLDESSPKGEKKLSFLQDISLRWNLDKLHKYFWIAVTVILLTIVGYFAYQQFLFVKNSPLEVKEVKVAEFIQEMQEQDSLITAQVSGNGNQVENETGELFIKLQSIHRTWIREIKDGADTTDYILTQGSVRNVVANQSVQLMLGRADGVNIWWNNDSLGIMGKENEVVLRLLLTKDGIVDKRLKVVSKKVKEKTDSTNSNF